jgi:hypothetical protein
MGITPDRFNHILNGRRPVPPPEGEFYARLADALACDIDDIQETQEEAAAA